MDSFIREAALLEAILFLESEPMDILTLSKVAGFDPLITEEALSVLESNLQHESRGLELIKVSGGYALTPKKELWDGLRDRYGRKNEGRLSKAALETLSIIAYSQPITRAEIESIRGVSADGMIRFLLERSFIREVGKKDIPGKPVQFGTTREFLKYFKLESIADLPKLDEVERERYEEEGKGEHSSPPTIEMPFSESDKSNDG
jgi:segregation and condensation protein B